MKKTNKTIKIVMMLIVVIMMLTVGSAVFAANDNDPLDPSKVMQGDNTGLSNKTGEIASTVVSVIQTIGVAVAVIMLIFVAIKYLTASPEGKAEMKKSIVLYVVGAVVLFGVSGLLGLLKTAVTNTIGDGNTKG